MTAAPIPGATRRAVLVYAVALAMLVIDALLPACTSQHGSPVFGDSSKLPFSTSEN